MSTPDIVHRNTVYHFLRGLDVAFKVDALSAVDIQVLNSKLLLPADSFVDRNIEQNDPYSNITE